MFLWLFIMLPIGFVVAGWAWRFQLRALHVTGLRLSQMAGVHGTLVDVELTSVLAEQSSVLIAFRPSGMRLHPSHCGGTLPPPSTLVLALEGDGQVAVARLKRWEVSTAPLLLWRDPSGDMIELSQIQTGQRLCLPVLARSNMTPQTHEARRVFRQEN
jgi:hypothetical protein